MREFNSRTEKQPLVLSVGSGRWIGLSLFVMGLLLAMGCRSTPPPAEQPDDEVVEEPAQEDDEDAEFEDDFDAEREAEDVDAPDEEDTEEDRGETVASHVDARIDSALSDIEDGDIEGGRESLEGLVDEPEGGFLAAYNLGVLHEGRGEIDRAIEYYVQTLQRQPDFTPALTNLLRIYIRAGEIGEADALGREFVEKRPDNLDHRAAHLEVAIADGRYEDAIQGARFILRRDVDNVDAMVQFATAKYHLQQYEFAEAIAGTALGLSPERAEVYYLLGQIAWSRDEITMAVGHFEQAVDLQPRFLEALNNYAVLLYKIGDYEDAIAHLERAVEIAPHFADAYINLGNAHKELHNYEEAAESYRQAVEVDGENEDALMNLGLLYLEAPVPNLDEIERLERAIEIFQAYRDQVGTQQATQTPVGDYISQAHEAIAEIEEELEEERRQQAEEEAQEEEVQEEEVQEEEVQEEEVQEEEEAEHDGEDAEEEDEDND